MTDFDRAREVELLRQLRRELPGGLGRLPLQADTFAEFRRYLLSDAARPDRFPGWTPADQDPGLMLVEMWAYLLDILSFYEERIANQSYIRTAQSRPSIRRLVELLGYIPRPAVASSVTLAVEAEGHEPITIDAGTALQSEEFDDEPPQVFEVSSPVEVDPALNRFDITSAPFETLAKAYGATSTSVLHLENRGVNLRRNDEVFIETGSGVRKVRVHDREDIRDVDQERLVKLSLSPALSFGTGDRPQDIRLMKSTRVATGTVSGTSIRLNALYPDISPGEEVIIERPGGLVVRDIRAVATQEVPLASGTHTYLDEDDDETATIGFTANHKVTVLYFFGTLPGWGGATVHLNYVEGGRVRLLSQTSIEGDSPLQPRDSAADESVEELAGVDKELIWADKRDRAARRSTAFDVDDDGALTLTPDGLPRMSLPLRAYGNLVQATRGESVQDEVLGSGDATLANQSFELSRGPLTYLNRLSSHTAHGMTSTLTVYVDDVKWREIPYFFGAGPNDRVYTVREDDEGHATVRFGDGRRGARLPTGRGNVVAHYRFGAGEAAPGAGQISEWIDPPRDAEIVVNPLAAHSGDDSQRPEEIKANAPSSALLLGRAVSLKDFEAAALDSPGIDGVLARWNWHELRQVPVAQLWFIGTSEQTGAIRAHLRSMMDPTVHLEVNPSTARMITLTGEVVVKPGFDKAAVEERVNRRLLKEDGLLAPHKIGIGGALFCSQIFEEILLVEGTRSVRILTLREEKQGFVEIINFVGATAAERRLAADEGEHLVFESVEILAAEDTE